MINLRYHIVSITAVFLALGIGIAMGSSFLGAAAVDRVDENIRDVRREAADARAERDVQRDEAERLEELAAEMYVEGPATVFTFDLAETPVVVITVGGIDATSVAAVRTALASSGAQLEGVLRLENGLVDDGAAEELADVLDVAGATGAVLHDDLTTALASELTEHGVVPGEPAPDPGTTEPGTTEPGATTTEPGDTTTVPTDPSAPTSEPDGSATTVPGTEPAPEVPEVPEPAAIRALVASGFLSWEPSPGGPDASALLAGEDYRYVVVTGAGAEVPDAEVLLPVLQEMAADGPAPVVVASAAVGEETEAREAGRLRALAPIRDDDLLGARVSTVDDIEVFPGIAAVIGAVGDLAGTGRGHYGLGEGRDSLLPPP